jgi:hypothetical protein
LKAFLKNGVVATVSARAFIIGFMPLRPAAHAGRNPHRLSVITLGSAATMVSNSCPGAALYVGLMGTSGSWTWKRSAIASASSLIENRPHIVMSYVSIHSKKQALREEI